MMIDWIHTWPHVTAAFLASLVEFIEALTIVLAVGSVRGWRPALLGTGGGLVTLGALVAILGRALGAIPLWMLQLVIGFLLLLFGLSWLRKAVLRAAGLLPLHDEAEAYRGTTKALRRNEPAPAIWWDPIAIATTFKAVVLEGIEVVFIVIAVGRPVRCSSRRLLELPPPASSSCSSVWHCVARWRVCPRTS